MKLNAFGRHIEIVRHNDTWKTYYLGNEGKKRLAEDILVPSDLGEEELVGYIADLCHEWTTPRNNSVSVID